MASHRRPRPRTVLVPGPRAAAGLTTAALATVTLMSEPAHAAPAAASPSIAQVQAKVDALNHQAEAATQRYDQAQATTERARKKADALLDQVAEGAQRLNDARQLLGRYAAQEYRTGGLGQTATFLLTSNPQGFFEQAQLMKRATAQETRALTEFETRQASSARERTQAARSLRSLTTAQHRLATDKRTVQSKLRQAQALLNSLTAAQKAKLARLRERREAAERAASAKLASAAHGLSSAAYAAKAAEAIAFARAQLGKPYVWGATGPDSYDCSGLTQAAWAAAGVSLPRTTWDQIKVGTRVSISDLQPGDLVFYNSDNSHVAMYIGDGKIIQAPHTGAVVDIEPVTEMPIYGATRP